MAHHRAVWGFARPGSAALWWIPKSHSSIKPLTGYTEHQSILADLREAGETVSRKTSSGIVASSRSGLLARRAGADLRLLQKKMGHASITVTEHIYADLYDDELDGVASALDALDDRPAYEH